MTMLKVTPFSGLIPKLGNRLLPDSNATIANNIKLQSGEMRPLNDIFLINTPNKPMPPLSIYRARNGVDASAWFSWPFEVDVVRAPLSVDVISRFYWTGEGAPKFATHSEAISSGLNNYPSLSYDLGIPTPQTKPTVSHSSGVGIASTRFYVYTYFSQYGEESAPSPISDIITGKVDGTWAISGMNEFPTNSGTITGTYASGPDLTTFNNTNRHWLRVGDEIILSTTTIIVKSTPTPTTFTVAGNHSANVSWARKYNWNTSSMKRRLYRTSGTKGAFQLVADDVSTSYNDTLTDAQILGDELISNGWVPPPIGLKHLAVHSSGALVGMVDNQLCFSEPYQPHAWPTSYQLSTDYDGVGLAVFGTEIGIGTEGNPYIASGVDPASMSLQKIDGVFPCFSKRSVVSAGSAFLYATNHGYVSIGLSGTEMVSDQFYTKDEWRDLNPSSMIATIAYGRIYIAYQTELLVKRILIMEQGLLITSDIAADGLYTDIATGELYISNDKGINEWDSVEAFQLNGSWRSKEFILPSPVNMGAAKVDFDLAVNQYQLDLLIAQREAIIANNLLLVATGKAGGEYNDFYFNEDSMNESDLSDIPDLPPSNLVTFILRKTGGDIVFSRVVSSTKAFRLPDGYKSDVFSIEVLSQCAIKEIRIAETMDELRSA